ncbi:STAS domain-containing protein [Streptomyces sp. NPDC005962]|uniref:STAS domain-containing protein n=1 Tax=Streptomyces sp. NPDC005962 TaxID=3154466 RepID=UPI0033E31D89
MDAPDQPGTRPVAEKRVSALKIRPLTGRAGIRVSGEVTLTTRASWEQALKDALHDGCGDVMLDLSGLTFIDVGGATALVLAAQDLDGRRRLVIKGPPPTLRRTLAAFSPESAAIEVTT